jgi:predicted nuclease of predicted toxin-antitoxin system
VRILLDESLPRPLTRLLPGHEVRTVSAVGWTGNRNGELLKLAAGSFDVFVTADQNLEHQQNLGALPIAVVVLIVPTNRIESLQPLIPALLRALETVTPRELIHVGA